MRAGGKMVLVHIISISREMIGIGRSTLPSETRGLVSYQDSPTESAYYSLSHHYSVLGLDRFRTTPYTDAEIKQ
ncbi:hypothetical protein PIB30_048754 [Stylosanthes scabra]|uniref:Uncharacterized protein n=1 Tax=Stylosanthes scabra TaxID=79078 RepID=A0ABU6QGU9_9FABA|nr:hypothetical protein [Stylosanthes scabra]